MSKNIFDPNLLYRVVAQAVIASTGHHKNWLMEIFKFLQIQFNPKYSDPRHLVHFEKQVYSQNGEDGIIMEIFRRIGTENKQFVEIGVGDGLENNTTNLLIQGWGGLWVDCNKNYINKITKKFCDVIKMGRLRLTEIFIDVDNVLGVLRDCLENFDFLSLDIDYNDFWVLKKILEQYKPRVICVEYGAQFPPPIRWKAKYAPKHVWEGIADFCHSASLQSFEDLGNETGYGIVACDFRGVNTFMVRKDLLEKSLDRHFEYKFLEPYTAEHFWEEPKYHGLFHRGHQPNWIPYEV